MCFVIVDYTDGCNGCTVGSDCREGKDRFILHVAKCFASVDCTAAAYGKYHICCLELWILRQHIYIGVCGISAIPDEIGNFHIGACYCIKQCLLCLGNCRFAADNNSFRAVRSTDISYFLIRITAYAIAR